MKNQENAQIEEENKLKALKEKKQETKEIKKPDAAKLV